MNARYKETNDIREIIDAIRIRVEVFIKEQGCEPGWEPDEDDKKARQFIALDGKKAIATARVIERRKGEFKIERMAVMKEYRGKGIGNELLKHIVNCLRGLKTKRIWMQSQARARGFYEKSGFRAVSEIYDLHGIQHIDM